MALELSTAGILVKWAVEATAGTRPTTGYATIRGVKSIPEYNPTPNNLDATDLSATEWKWSIPGLKDPGGALGLTVNDYAAFRADWAAMLTAYKTAKADGKGLWVEYMIPDLTDGADTSPKKQSYFYPAIPSELGFNGAEVDAVLENVAYFMPNGAPVWAEQSTAS